MRAAKTIIIAIAAVLAGCNPPGNVTSSNTYNPPDPPVLHPRYDPYAPYGQADAVWVPPVYDRNGTIVAPSEPASQRDRPDYEHARWATGAAGGSQYAPPGTF
jgi:hypothetical protein